jgi:hypothetical protein
MLKQFFLFTIILFSLLGSQSCKKHRPGPSDDIPLCVQRNNYSYSVQGNGITDSQMDTVRQLFQENNLSLDNLQTEWMMPTKGYINISMNQFVNNLPVFYGEMSFVFRKINGVYTIDSLGIIGQRINAGRINPNPHVTPLHATNIMYQQMINDRQIAGWDANWKDSCFSATLGITQINNLSNGQLPKYGLVWRITPKNLGYPLCLVNAISGELVSYSNGIIIF